MAYLLIKVSAAGNSGGFSPANPASYAMEYGFSVGAIESDRTIAHFSNGAGDDSNMYDLVAPGVDIFSTLPDHTYASWI
ncbi:MAG: S8 family serine peptidase [Moorea sp. SIO3G5]|nr:S8 family serine peptidase [Moorena sp. SIO3G5]